MARTTSWLSLALCLILAGCGGPLSLLTGGGPNVAANVPVAAGETAGSTGVGLTNVTSTETRFANAGDAESNEAKTDSGDVTVNNGVPWWIWLLVLAGWLLDSPQRIAGDLMGAFRRREKA